MGRQVGVAGPPIANGDAAGNEAGGFFRRPSIKESGRPGSQRFNAILADDKAPYSAGLRSEMSVDRRVGIPGVDNIRRQPPHELPKSPERDRIQRPPPAEFRDRSAGGAKLVRQGAAAIERRYVNVEALLHQPARQQQQLRRHASSR
jgi:hypothetical protein